jgi:hypothetical protein
MATWMTGSDRPSRWFMFSGNSIRANYARTQETFLFRAQRIFTSLPKGIKG